MLFFTSSLDHAADGLVSASSKLAEAKRRGVDTSSAQREVDIAEAAWQAVCDGVRGRSRRPRDFAWPHIAGRKRHKSIAP